MEDLWMSDSEYDKIIEKVPLVSIDLIIRNKAGEYLLNYRGNRPAQNTWFFFGGAIKKTEEIESAFDRIIEREFKGFVKPEFSKATFTKPVTHKYLENRKVDVTDYKSGIHYVVLCYELTFELSQECIDKIVAKHSEDSDPHVLKIEWFKRDEVFQNSKVHENVKKYFNKSPYFTAEHLLSLYAVTSKSLNTYTTVIWAFPLLFLGFLGTLFKSISQEPEILLFITLIGYILIHAFIKHTLMHESLVKSTKSIEEQLKGSFNIGGIDLIPNFQTGKFFDNCHKIVRTTLVVINTLLLLYSLCLMIKR